MGVILTAAWRSRAWPLWTRYAGATALSLLGFFVQLALRQEIPPHFFLLSLPATLFSAVLFGGNPATWSIALSAGSTG